MSSVNSLRWRNTWSSHRSASPGPTTLMPTIFGPFLIKMSSLRVFIRVPLFYFPPLYRPFNFSVIPRTNLFIHLIVHHQLFLLESFLTQKFSKNSFSLLGGSLAFKKLFIALPFSIVSFFCSD